MKTCVLKKAVKQHITSSHYVDKTKLTKAVEYAFRRREAVEWDSFNQRMTRYYSVANQKGEEVAGDICYLMVHVGQELE